MEKLTITNGIITNENGKIVCSSIFAPVTVTEIPVGIQTVDALDGSVVKLWYYFDTWNVSTTKTKDGNCYWSSGRSFKDLVFEIATPEFLEKLDKEYTHIYILKHVENRNIIRNKTNELILITRIHNKTQQEIRNQDFPKGRSDAIGECYTEFDGLHYATFIKYSEEFLIAKEHLGNRKNIFDGYIKWFLKTSPADLMCLKNTAAYLGDTEEVAKIEKDIEEFCDWVISLYIETHIIKSVFIPFNHEYSKILRALHKIRKTERRRLEISDVKTIFSSNFDYFLKLFYN